MTRYVTATLIKRRTEDGLMEVWEHVPLGKTYEVDLDSIRTDDLFNLIYQREHTKESIACRDGGRMATELLDIPKEKKDG